MASSKIDCLRPHQPPGIDELPFQFNHTMDLSVIDRMLHYSSDLVIHKD